MAALDRPARAARRGAILLPLIALGCDGSPVAGPMPQGPATPPAAVLKDGSISGTVFEHGAGRPLAAAGIRLRLRNLSSTRTMDVVSDAAGHYEFSDVPAGAAVVIAPPLDSDYRAPCPYGMDVYSGAGSWLDVHVVPTAVLMTTGVPASLPTYSIAVRGTLLGPSGVVGGATVELANFAIEPLSTTFSAPDGTFLVCVPPPGVGADQDIEIRVRKNGYRPVTYVENLGWAGTAGTLYLWLSLLPE